MPSSARTKVRFLAQRSQCWFSFSAPSGVGWLCPTPGFSRMPVIGLAPWAAFHARAIIAIVAAPYRASLSNQSDGEDNGPTRTRTNAAPFRREEHDADDAHARGMVAALLMAVAAMPGRARRARPTSTRAGPSSSTSATASAAAMTSMPACSPATWASTFRAIRPWCRRTWRALARCGSPTGSTTSAPKDGTAFGDHRPRHRRSTRSSATPRPQFDGTKYTWIGSANNEVSDLRRLAHQPASPGSKIC